MRISVAGTGYVGLVTAACLADTGNDVVAYDVDAAKIGRLRRGECPIFEPALPDLIRQNAAAGRLRFTDNVAEAVARCRVMFVAIGTPQGPDGSADLANIDAFASAMVPYLTRPIVLVVKSTVPIGTCEMLEERINKASTVWVDVVSNPEFLKEGSSVADFQRPDRVVIGAAADEAYELVRELHLPFVRNNRPILRMPRRAAEMVKYASNSYLAARISFINEIANLCDRCDIDVDDVRRGMGTDLRIGFQFLYPGAGYGGSCFPKDVPALIHTARRAGVEPRMLSAVHDVNTAQKRVLFDKISRRFGDELGSLTCAVWGVTFKPNTDDVREAPALTLIDQLIEAGAAVRAFDPQGLDNLRRLYGGRVAYCDDRYVVLDGADCLVVCTEWNQFRSPDFEAVRARLHRPIVFDGRNLYDASIMRRYGLEYYPIGKTAVTAIQPRV